MILFEKKNKYGSFNDLMDVSIETGDKWLDKKLNTNICYGKGGGGSAPQDVPRTLRPYVKQVLDRAQGLYGSYLPQQLYQGERIVGFTPASASALVGCCDNSYIVLVIRRCVFLSALANSFSTPASLSFLGKPLMS